MIATHTNIFIQASVRLILSAFIEKIIAEFRNSRVDFKIIEIYGITEPEVGFDDHPL